MQTNDKKLDELIIAIEKYKRRLAINKNDNQIDYINIGNEVEKIKVSCCHLVEARRGCGKTTLIIKSVANEKEIMPIYIDCQKYIENRQDEIILGICKEIIETYYEFLSSNGILKSETVYNKKIKGIKGFLRKKFGLIDEKLVVSHKNYSLLEKILFKLNIAINDMMNKPEEQELYYESSLDNAYSKTEKKVKAKGKNISINNEIGKNRSYLELEAKINSIFSYKYETNKSIEESKENRQINKVATKSHKTINRADLINEFKLCLAQLFTIFNELYKKRTILFLDDFYQIPNMNHPRILQYFHGIYKESKDYAFCMNAVGIPESIKINYDGKTTFSKKDDLPSIVLNYDLAKLELLQDNLVKIMVTLQPQLEILESDIKSLLTNDTLKYLVIASGGIPRDFMTTFADTLDNARKREINAGIARIDLYKAIAKLKQDKDENRETELSEYSEKAIEIAIQFISDNIIKGLKTNVILYPKKDYEKHERLIKTLINLRYLHIIKSHITPEGKNFEAVGLLIDMTFYATNGRMPNGFIPCEFWKVDAHSSELRRAKIWRFVDDFVESLDNV